MLAHDLQRFSAELLETLGVSGNYRSRVQGRSLVYDEQLLVAQLFFPDKVEPQPEPVSLSSNVFSNSASTSVAKHGVMISMNPTRRAAIRCNASL